MAILDVGPIRGMRNVEGKLFVVAAQTLYQISNTGVAIPYGTIPGVGRVSMAHNQSGLGNELIVVNGSAGYVFDTNVNILTKITDEGYPGAFIADYIDQYLAQVEPQGRFWFHSDLANGTDYSTLDRYEAEADPDRIVSLLVSHREVLVFGRDTIEPFVNTGGQTGTFERASNTVIEVGCAAKFTPRKLDNSIFWLDDKRLVRRLDGYTPIRVSTDAIDSAFQECSEAEVANCYAFTWESRGHKVYYITIPGRFTFGYDVLTRSWHRRSTWGLEHWDVVDAVYWNGRWIVGSGRYGRLYELDWDYKLDSCDPLVRKRVTGKLWDDENDLTLNNVELKFNTGGPDSVCVLFPDQPVGPTITGTPPGGSIGVPYAGYTFTTTPGDAPIARTIVLTGSIPDGLSWNQNTATISTGTPTENGLFSFTLRTIDTNGLYADLDVEILIGLPMLAIRGRNQSGSNYSDYLRGDNGSAWASNSWTQLTDAAAADPLYISSIGDRFIFWADSGNLLWSDDYAATTTASTGDTMGGSGGFRGYVVLDDLSAIFCGGTNEMRITNDAGDTLNIITGSPDSNLIAVIDANLPTEKIIAVDMVNNMSHVSDDRFATFTSHTGPGIFATGGFGAFTFDRKAYFLGNTGGTTPYLGWTEDGITFTPVTLPAFATASTITCAAVGVLDGEACYALGTSSGEIAYLDPADDTVKLSSYSLGVRCRGMAFSGAVFSVIGSQSGTGKIANSTTLDAWTEQRSETGQTAEWYGLSARSDM
jgi:hypothetical protein